VIELGADVDDGLDLRVDGRHVERRAAEERGLHHLGQRRDLRLQYLGHKRLDQGLTDGVTHRLAQALAEASDVGLLERCRDAARETVSGNTESLDKVRDRALNLRLQLADLPLRSLDLRPQVPLCNGVGYAAAKQSTNRRSQGATKQPAKQS